MEQSPATFVDGATEIVLLPEDILVKGIVTDETGKQQAFVGKLRFPVWVREALEGPHKIVLLPRLRNFFRRLIQGILIAGIASLVSLGIKYEWFNDVVSMFYS